MKGIIGIVAITTLMLTACSSPKNEAVEDNFEYANERFADLQMLRYKVEGFENLSLNQKLLIYYLSEAAMYGRDILYDQNGKYNLRIREMLETIYQSDDVDRESEDFKAMEIYLKRVWFSNGTIIFLPVTHVSQFGPQITNFPVGLTCKSI